ncbi:AfsR/SARP family transcriptional regulator [Micromonospora auratinigra]|uniref:DNA-binding transcriptional activator of the SARP family n=1 Tax=Micromonospora auratinigra TaxID=261654 RepID=A0A1A8ZIC5_9ACTN|nr:AfsR/SARP family transcriptional regulator [Micromonospora auratinigra]SBT43623.1 DNA-binding transcriptional activator of the SARP family [Micromonospora auratinigra]
MTRFAVLGPLTISLAAGPRSLPAAMQRKLLAVLLSQTGRVVSLATLTEALWGAAPPARPQQALQVYVHRLRRALDDERRLAHQSGGYLLRVARDELDVHHFTDLLTQARTAVAQGRRAHADACYEQALRLWRGPAYADVTGVAVIDDEVARLTDQHLHCQEERIGVRLRLGRYAEVIGELRSLTEAHPYRENLRVMLMTALHGVGRQAEALEVYSDIRTILVDQLGVEPGAALRRLHLALLRGDGPGGAATSPAAVAVVPVPSAAAVVPAPPAAVPAPPRPVSLLTAARPSTGVPTTRDRAAPPDQPPAGRCGPCATNGRRGSVALDRVPALLPADVYRYVARREPLAELDALLTRPDQVGALPVVVVTGGAGVGKSALTVHWAHRIADRFPDGQLYVDLHGSDPMGSVPATADVVRGFLSALGAPAHGVPTDLSGQINLYRTLLHGRRMLVLLDNARDAGQVQPLLPGSTGCLIVVTSRDHLLPLVARQGAYPVPLAPLTAGESYELLRQRLGAGRLAADPTATGDLIAGCAGVPQALAMAAAHAATYPELPLRQLVDRIGGLRGPS